MKTKTIKFLIGLENNTNFFENRKGDFNHNKNFDNTRDFNPTADF